MATVGIHVVWTTYGTWLPGDPRGHWSPLLDFYGHLQMSGGQLNLQDPATLRFSNAALKEPARLLRAEDVDVVARLLAEHVEGPHQSQRSAKPRCYAAAIEENHLHLLFGPVDEELGRFVGRLKGTTSSADLKLEHNLGRKRTWTDGFWKVFLFDDAAFLAAKAYIEA